jgi:hypothetical protein
MDVRCVFHVSPSFDIPDAVLCSATPSTATAVHFPPCQVSNEYK